MKEFTSHWCTIVLVREMLLPGRSFGPPPTGGRGSVIYMAFTWENGGQLTYERLRVTTGIWLVIFIAKVVSLWGYDLGPFACTPRADDVWTRYLRGGQRETASKYDRNRSAFRDSGFALVPHADRFLSNTKKINITVSTSLRHCWTLFALKLTHFRTTIPTIWPPGDFAMLMGSYIRFTVSFFVRVKSIVFLKRRTIRSARVPIGQTLPWR